MKDASTRFNKMVTTSGIGHDVKQPFNPAEDALKNRQKAINNKSSNGLERAKEVKTQSVDPALQEKMDRMIAKRFGS